MTEKQLQKALVDLARMRGYLVYHTFDSRRSDPGFPDLICVKPGVGGRPGRLAALEVKADRGAIRPMQLAWIAAIDTVPGCRGSLIRPGDLQHAADLLAGADT